jgi:hypothetical protein
MLTVVVLLAPDGAAWILATAFDALVFGRVGSTSAFVNWQMYKRTPSSG